MIEIVNACFFFLHSKNTKEMIAIWERDQFGYPVCIDEKHVSGFWRCGGKRTDSGEERREITEDATKRYQYLKKSSNILLPLLKFFNDDYVMFIW